MSYLEELLPEFRKGAKIMRTSEAKILGKQPYYFFKDKEIWYNNGISEKNFGSRPFTTSKLMADNWELYQEPEPDWDYIIKNKCLCWFWDTDESNKRAGILKIISENINVLYWNNYDQQWLNCRPVRRDEVNFYEDKKDEQD